MLGLGAMLGGGMWGQQLQKLQQKMQARQLSPGEQRYQSAQPFDAIRQQLMQQGVGVTPGLMQSYQNQAGAQEASPVGGLMGGGQVFEQDAAGNRGNGHLWHCGIVCTGAGAQSDATLR